MTAEDYERWSAPFRKNPALQQALLAANAGCTIVFYPLFPVLLVRLYRLGRNWLLPLCFAGAAFAALSLYRRIRNAPRPRQALGITPLIPKEDTGKSFPSRHVFCAFLIAAMWLCTLPRLGWPLMLLASLLAVLRVIGGVHFPKDVAVGAALGLAAGLTAMSL